MYSKEVIDKVMKSLAKGEAVNEIAEKYQVSKSTIYNWNKKYANKMEKLNGLIKLSKEINELMKEGKLEDALELCTEEACQKDLCILSQKIAILTHLGKLEEALELCTEEACTMNPVINRQRRLIINKLKYVGIYDENNLNSIESELITKLYLDILKEDEIKSSDLIEWHKEVLLIGYYEKKNKTNVSQFIKELKEKYKDDYMILKDLNILRERLISKRKFFDITIYETLLKASVNFNKAEEYLESKSKEDEFSCIETDKFDFNKQHVNVLNSMPKKSLKLDKQEVKQQAKIIISSGKTINRFDKDKAQVSDIKNISNKEFIETKDLLLKDIFKKEILEIQRQIYIRMQDFEQMVKACRAWDSFENLINMSINDKFALNKFRRILLSLEVINEDKLDTDYKSYFKS